MILNASVRIRSLCLGATQTQKSGDAHEDEGADAAKGQRGSFLTGRCQKQEPDSKASASLLEFLFLSPNHRGILWTLKRTKIGL